MDIGNNKTQILFDEYKKGFNEIANIVDGFKGMSSSSQQLFISEREKVLKMQLDFNKKQKEQVIEEVRQFLVKANSEILTLQDIEDHINDELKKCLDMRELVIKSKQ